MTSEQIGWRKPIPDLRIGNRWAKRFVFYVFGLPVLLLFGGLPFLLIAKGVEQLQITLAFCCCMVAGSVYLMHLYLEPSPRPGRIQHRSVRPALIAIVVVLGVLLVGAGALLHLLGSIIVAQVWGTTPPDHDVTGGVIIGVPLFYTVNKVVLYARLLWAQYRREGITTAAFAVPTYGPGEQVLVRIDRTGETDPDELLTLMFRLVDEKVVVPEGQRAILYSEEWMVTGGRASDGVRFTIPDGIEGQSVTADYRNFGQPKYWELCVDYGDGYLNQFIIDVQ